MVYSKVIVLSLIVLTLFSSSCLIATYKVNQEIKKMNVGIVAMLEQ